MLNDVIELLILGVLFETHNVETVMHAGFHTFCRIVLFEILYFY